jgi:hypothetical protein
MLFGGESKNMPSISDVLFPTHAYVRIVERGVTPTEDRPALQLDLNGGTMVAPDIGVYCRSIAQYGKERRELGEHPVLQMSVQTLAALGPAAVGQLKSLGLPLQMVADKELEEPLLQAPDGSQVPAYYDPATCTLNFACDRRVAHFSPHEARLMASTLDPKAPPSTDRYQRLHEIFAEQMCAQYRENPARREMYLITPDAAAPQTSLN